MKGANQLFNGFLIIEAFQDWQTEGLTQLVLTWQLRYRKRHERSPSDNSCDFFFQYVRSETPSVFLFERYCPSGLLSLPPNPCRSNISSRTFRLARTMAQAPRIAMARFQSSSTHCTITSSLPH